MYWLGPSKWTGAWPGITRSASELLRSGAVSYYLRIDSSFPGILTYEAWVLHFGSVARVGYGYSIGTGTGEDWNLSHRIASVIVGGFKLAGAGFISSIGAVASSNILYVVRKLLNQSSFSVQRNNRTPTLKTALMYASFLRTSVNLWYQPIMNS